MRCVPVVEPRVDAAIPFRVSKERAIRAAVSRRNRLHREIFIEHPPGTAFAQMRDRGKRSGERVTSIFQRVMNGAKR
ncbi:hypothetical protein [Burkholderia arboris]|uniref:hypothetical protein n=1 Tax=Burkholderia arboris TaxID=488730 RepID=UPI00210923EC|nr:hypothetical protein [Burkholderia arboris]UTV60355.1 hypothetical protein NLX30_34800 [Burkholderia arboris]